jgi:hypothetical protein
MGLFDFLKKKSKERRSQKSDGKIELDFSPVTIQPDDVVPIEKRIRGKKPTCDGLYPHEVLVLSYAPRYCDSGNEYPRFWWYSYGIKDVTSILHDLQQKGLIEVGNIFDAINLEKLPVIKEELKKRELKVTGKKVDLVARLIENVSEEELARVFTRKPFTLTADAETILKKYEWIPYIHAHHIEGLDIWNLTEMVQTPPYMKFRDKIWGHFNKLCMIHGEAGDWGLYRNTLFQMSEFLAEEGRINNALHLLCNVASHDLSGLSNGFKIEHLYIYAEHFFPYETSSIKMAPGITNRIKKYSDTLELNKDQLRELLLEEMKKGNSPLQLFTPEECTDIVLCEIDGDTEALEKLYSVAEKRFRKNYKNQLKRPW